MNIHATFTLTMLACCMVSALPAQQAQIKSTEQEIHITGNIVLKHMKLTTDAQGKKIRPYTITISEKTITLLQFKPFVAELIGKPITAFELRVEDSLDASENKPLSIIAQEIETPIETSVE